MGKNKQRRELKELAAKEQTKLSVNVPVALVARLDAMATEIGQPRSWVIRQALDHYTREYNNK